MIRQGDRELKRTWQLIFDELPDDSKRALRKALRELRRDALARAQHQWEKHKAPMAFYWKVVGVYAGHLARAIK